MVKKSKDILGLLNLTQNYGSYTYQKIYDSVVGNKKKENKLEIT